MNLQYKLGKIEGLKQAKDLLITLGFSAYEGLVAQLDILIEIERNKKDE